MKGEDHVFQEEEKGIGEQTHQFELVKDYMEELKTRGGLFFAIPKDKRGIEDRIMIEENATFRCCHCQKIPFEPMRCNGCGATLCKDSCNEE